MNNKKDISIDQRLEELFPQYKSRNNNENWENLKINLSLGSGVEGKIVFITEFGAFININNNFPALMLLTKTRIDFKQSSIGQKISGRVYVFDDSTKQIGITQLNRESWMKGNW